MNWNKPLIVLAVLLAAALIPSVLAQGFNVGPGWSFSNGATSEPTVSASPTPTPSASKTPDPTTSPTQQPPVNPTTKPVANPTVQATPTPTVPEFSALAVLILAVTLLASALLYKHRRDRR